jgi:hypothetical protein
MSRLRVSVLLTLGAGASCLAAPAVGLASPGDFGSAGEFKTASGAFDLATGDFDDDGVIDVATANANGPNATVLLGDGDGTFSEARKSPITTGASPLGVAAGDLDGDGISDLVITESGPDTISVLLSKGNGAFTKTGESPIAVGPDPRRVAVGSFDGDADLDLAVVNANSAGPGAGSVSILLGDGDGTFAQAPGSPVGVGQFPVDVAVGAFNGDSNPDLAVTNSGDDSVSVLLGNGLGGFAPTPGTEGTGDGPWDMVAANLNGDSFADLAVGNAFTENMTVLLGSATGDFSPAPTSPEPEGDQAVTSGDFDGDGDVDLASNQAGDEISILLNNGSGDFTAAPTSPEKALFLVGSLASADTDGDGDRDLLAGGGNGGYYAVTSLLNDEPDEDGDGFLDTADECPSVSGDITGCPITHRLVSLRYKQRAEVFAGRLTLNPGGGEEPSCFGAGNKVRVFRSTNSGPARLGTALTNAKGRFRLAETVKRGRFYAMTPRSLDPLKGICNESTSPTIQVTPQANP